MSEQYKLNLSVFVRDPIYGFIGLTDKEVALINTSVFQRLRKIKQLGNAHLVYPSACHTRFEHSLGALHVAYLMAMKLKLSPKEIVMIRYAGLLHDIGHGPLSHNFESVLAEVNKGILKEERERLNDEDFVPDHEYVGHRIIEESKEISDVLKEDKTEVLKILKGDPGYVDDIHRQIIDSMLDADKLDYLQRDSYHAGVNYGLFDFERILNTIAKKKEGTKYFLKIMEKGTDAYNNYRIARQLMYDQVYFHHVKLVSEKMFERSMKLAIDEDKNHQYIPSLNIKDPEFISNYLSLNDENVYQKILRLDPNNKANTLMNMVETRKLFKRGFEASHLDFTDDKIRGKLSFFKEREFKILEQKIADHCNCDKDFIIAYRQSFYNPLFKSTYDMIRDNESPLDVLDDKGETHVIDGYWPFDTKREAPFKFYVFCLEENKTKVKHCTPAIIKELIHES